MLLPRTTRVSLRQIQLKYPQILGLFYLRNPAEAGVQRANQQQARHDTNI